MVARQEIGIESHVGSAPRIGVVAKTNKLRARHGSSKLHKRCDVLPTDLRTKYDDEILLSAQLVTQRDPCVASGGWIGDGLGSGVVSRKKPGDGTFAACRNLQEAHGLTSQLDRL